jgi:membrane-bound lytic murein transglycosylase B
MAIPMIAAGIAVRAVAKKLATRAAGGITGAGAKQVSPVYRNMNTGNVKVLTNVKAEAKDLGISKKVYQKTANDFMTDMVKSTKSGQSAKEVASLREVQNLKGILSGKTGNPKIIKIKSGK